MGAHAPGWVAVRNFFDPQIKTRGTLRQQGKLAVQICKDFDRWSPRFSSIVCWALIAAEQLN